MLVMLRFSTVFHILALRHCERKGTKLDAKLHNGKVVFSVLSHTSVNTIRQLLPLRLKL